MIRANAVSVIVPTIGRPESLIRLLESLCSQTVMVHQVVIADGSADGLTAAVAADERWLRAGLRVESVKVQPPHATRQRVAAIAASDGEFLLLLDDDVALEPECVEKLRQVVASDPGIVGASADFSNHRWPAPTAAWHFYLRRILRLPEGAWQGRVVGPLLRFGFRPVPSENRPIEWLATGNTLLRRSAYLEAGGFSDFFLHRSTINEDVDLGLKISRRGTIMFCPAARLAHFHAAGGRVTPTVAAEDDLYNRFLILRHTQQLGFARALAMVVLYFVVETTSNLIGGVRRGSWEGLGARTFGRLRALGRAFAVPALLPAHWLHVVFDHPRPLRFITAKFLAWSGLSQFLTLQLDGYQLRVYPSNATLNLWISAASRVHGLELFRDYCAAGDVVVDVGANVGEVSIVLSQKVGPGGQVFAFEPVPRIYGYLRGNLALNRCMNVITHNLALGAAAGSVRMTDDRRDDMNRVVRDGGITVPGSTLDLEVPESLSPALIKVDVEGTELFVLQGGPEVLSRTACVNCEMWELHFRRNGYSMGDLIAFMRDAGFVTFVIQQPRQLRPVDSSFADPGGHELVAVRDVANFLARTGWSLVAAGPSAGVTP